MRGTLPSPPELRLQDSYVPWSQATSPTGGATVSACGTAWHDGRPLAGNELAVSISTQAGSASRERRLDELLDLSRQLNGAWAYCVQWPDGETIAAVDRLRTMPLFYGHQNDGRLTLSNRSASLADCDGARTLDDGAALELLLSGSVMGSRTLYKGVSQFEPGELLDWRDGALSKHRHYRFLRAESSTEGPESLTRTLHATMDEVFDRYARQFAGQRVIVPLSGGLDSRLVLAMLKRHGHRDLVALNYGRPGAGETETSRAVAEALGIPWVFIPYDDGDWHSLMSTPAMREFWHYAGQAAGLPNLQDYLALHRLRRRDPGLEAVFLPGLVGDMIAGMWTPGSAAFRGHGPTPQRLTARDEPVDLPAVRDWLLISKYALWPARKDEIGEIDLRMRSFFAGVRFSEAHNSAVAFELFEFENRQARYIANSVRSYEFHGYAWWLPLCDSRLMDFFLTVPTGQREARRLYASWMRSHIFVNGMSRLAEIPPIGDGHFSWYGEPRPDRVTMLGQATRSFLLPFRSIEPRLIRSYRHSTAVRGFSAPDLRFHEWFAEDDARARSMKLKDLMGSSGSVLSGLPASLMDLIRIREDYPVCLIEPLGILAAAYVAETYRSSRTSN